MKKNNDLRLATVFSGIGAIEFALKRMGIKYSIVFACDNGEREIKYDIDQEKQIIKTLHDPLKKKKYIDELYSKKTNGKNYVKLSYLANYPNFNENYYYQDIRLLDGNDFKNKVDLFVGGSPCQSFSSVGFQRGLDDTRGTLFYEFARLIKEIQPKVFIYENVRNLIKHNHGKTWDTMKDVFKSIGYDFKYAILNSSDYGIPQTRRRLFVVGFKKHVKNFEMPPKIKKLKYEMKDFCIDNCSEGCFKHNSKGEIIIERKNGVVGSQYILSPKLYKYVMKGGTKSFYQKPIINKKIARTILKTMGNRHRAGIDNYLSFDGTEKIGSVRMLTERESLRLMGYTDDFSIVVSRAQIYRQAGNSIVVDVMIALIKEIFKSNLLKE